MKINSGYSNFLSTISSLQDKKEVTKTEKSKVENIKEAISAGTYKIDINKTASKMAKDLL
jgi:anti-sigma28 factor (negative regulator of flagellin synthesis)